MAPHVHGTYDDWYDNDETYHNTTKTTTVATPQTTKKRKTRTTVHNHDMTTTSMADANKPKSTSNVIPTTEHVSGNTTVTLTMVYHAKQPDGNDDNDDA